MQSFLEAQSTLIVANGEKPDRALLDFYRAHAQVVIALDGAALWLKDLGIKPDLVIGDFDSAHIDQCTEFKTCFVDDQNSNDLEKAFDYCVKHRLDKITVLGAFGLRVDHVLTNFHVLCKFARKLKINFVDTTQIAFVCPLDRELIITDQENAFISLFPFADEVGPITTNGLEYPLISEKLYLKNRIGTLNRITSVHASITCTHGDLVVVIEMPKARGAHRFVAA